MAASLCIVFNTKLTGKETEEDWQKYCDMLNASGRFEAYYLNEVSETDKWSFEIDQINEDSNGHHLVVLDGPSNTINLYPDLGFMGTSYSFSHLYEFGQEAYDSGSILWKERKSIYDLISLFGGTEVIYVADDRYPKITYLEELYAGMPYETIKSQLLQLFGPPVTDYRDLNEDMYNPYDLKEFFLDDFADIKSEFNPYFTTDQFREDKARKVNLPMKLSEEALKAIAVLLYKHHEMVYGERLMDVLNERIGLYHLDPDTKTDAVLAFFFKQMELKNGKRELEKFLIQYFSPSKFQDRMNDHGRFIATLNLHLREEGWLAHREGDTLIFLDIRRVRD